MDGRDDAVVVPRDPSMNVGAGDFTVSAWIRPSELRQCGIVCLGKYSWTHGWYLDMPNNQGVLRIETANPDNQPNGTVQSRPGVIRVNQWQHVAAVVRRGENQTLLYVNGFQVTTGTIAPKVLDNPKVDLHIGRIQDSKLFKGRIDGVRLYTRALGEMEIQALVAPGRKAGLSLKSPPVKPEDVTLVLGGREFMATRHQPAFLAVRLPAGPMEFSAKTSSGAAPHQVNFTPIPANSELAKRFERFEKRSPWLGVHLGLRRDCGSTFSPVQRPMEVAGTALREYVFEGAINNYPSDDVQEDNDNYLAGVREIGVRSEHTDGRDRPRLRIRSVEFEGPFYESWPPATHRRIFIGSANEDKTEVYAREIVREFAGRAYRRPVT
ncbi:MAG: LamG-like jellyroll fold domain-containing protein, partial [Pseudomonadota bacterium]|nr:LamG-like jellyroll fold domain-containing protein [Pseudomonadota bacterium]